MAKMFKALKNERFFEKVANSIQREILQGNLKPGQKLPSETELAKQFNVGRSAVREALKVLELSGLLYVKRGYNGGTFVKPPDPADAFAATTPIGTAITGWEQLMEARKLIEVRTAELASARADDEEIAALGEAVQRMRAATGVPARFIDEDVSFHLQHRRGGQERGVPLGHQLRTDVVEEGDQRGDRAEGRGRGDHGRPRGHLSADSRSGSGGGGLRDGPPPAAHRESDGAYPPGRPRDAGDVGAQVDQTR